MGHRQREIKAKSGAGRVYKSLGGKAFEFFDPTRVVDHAEQNRQSQTQHGFYDLLLGMIGARPSR
jgi:hypothetical protein